MVKVGPATDAGCCDGDKEGIRSLGRYGALVVFRTRYLFFDMFFGLFVSRSVLAAPPSSGVFGTRTGCARQVARLQMNGGGGEAQQTAGQQVKQLN